MSLRQIDHPELLICLRKIENAGMVGRDLVMLYAIGRQPGMMGLQLAKKLGYERRGSVHVNLRRLERLGFIEDRRTTQDKGTPNNLHITEAGEKILTDILPTE